VAVIPPEGAAGAGAAGAGAWAAEEEAPPEL